MTKPLPFNWPIGISPLDDDDFNFDEVNPFTMGKKKEAKQGASTNSALPLSHPPYVGKAGKEISVDGKSAVNQTTWIAWPLYKFDDTPPQHVRLDDKAIYEVLMDIGITAKRRATDWPADFDKTGDIRMNRANYGRPAYVTTSEGLAYAVFKEYYQLVGEEARDTLPGARYGEKAEDSDPPHITGGSLVPGRGKATGFTAINNVPRSMPKAASTPKTPRPVLPVSKQKNQQQQQASTRQSSTSTPGPSETEWDATPADKPKMTSGSETERIGASLKRASNATPTPTKRSRLADLYDADSDEETKEPQTKSPILPQFVKTLLNSQDKIRDQVKKGEMTISAMRKSLEECQEHQADIMANLQLLLNLPEHLVGELRKDERDEEADEVDKEINEWAGAKKAAAKKARATAKDG